MSDSDSLCGPHEERRGREKRSAACDAWALPEDLIVAEASVSHLHSDNEPELKVFGTGPLFAS